MKTLFTLLAFLCLTSVYAQPQWNWAKYATSDYPFQYAPPAGYAVCVDAQHNVYVTGSYIGDLYTGTDTLRHPGAANNEVGMFIAKYDVNGNLQWLKQAPSNFSSQGTAISVDDQGYIYVGGGFTDSIQFDSLRLYDTTGYGIFLAKYTPNGNAVWAKGITGTGEDALGITGTKPMVLDKQGHIYITGNFGNNYLLTANTTVTVHFDNITLVSTDTCDIFVAKYDTSGHAIWAKSAGKVRESSGFALAVDSLDNLFVTGYFSTPAAYFDSLKVATHSGDGMYAMFVAKYDSSGKVLWVKEADGDGETAGDGIVIDKAGNAIIFGSMGNDTTTFDNVHLILPPNGSLNCFLTKYSSSGNLMWAKNAGIDTVAENYPGGIAIDAHDYLFVTGLFDGTSYFNNDTIASKGGEDIFVASYDDNGNPQWLTTAGGPQDDESYCITIDPSGPIYVAGYFSDSCTFSNIALSGKTQNMFVAKLTPFADAVQQVNHTRSNISIYPNPAANSVTIDFGTAAFANLKVLDYTGRNILNQSVTGKQKIILNTGIIASGLYFIIAESNNGEVVSKKIVVQH
ncbi:MAG: T9SS type A sorting domain-containing protein [Flavipsychrobacter sp.]|nr:T9SS type A sorting domain-containing protein [Flavipsychrobacter sp.]